MASYWYEAVDAGGLKSQGTLDVTDQGEALKRIRDMGLFPTRVAHDRQVRHKPKARPATRWLQLQIPTRRGGVKPAVLAVFTRQLATLLDVGMPLMRGLRILEEQTENQALKRIIADVARTIEGGGTLSEGMAAHPRVFTPLYVNMVRAGELGGILEVALRRQAEFLEKALRIKRKVKTAMFYPAAVMVIAAAVLTLMLVFIIPRFQSVFEGMLNGKPLPGFTLFVLNISNAFRSHLAIIGLAALALFAGLQFLIRTRRGRRWFDRLKLSVPVLGTTVRKVALARFTRTFGTLLGSGVPILQALAIVKETSGNVIVGNVISKIYDSVKEGGSVAGPLKQSRIFPVMVVGMVDVGEQTGALPDLLVKIADTCDEEVDSSISALTSLLEPAMILFLAVVVGGIVIAMFLPIIQAATGGGLDPGAGDDGGI